MRTGTPKLVRPTMMQRLSGVRPWAAAESAGLGPGGGVEAEPPPNSQFLAVAVAEGGAVFAARSAAACCWATNAGSGCTALPACGCSAEAPVYHADQGSYC